MTILCTRPEVRYSPCGPVLSDDTINCSNLANDNRRIHSRARDVWVRWEDTLHMVKERVLY